MSVSAVKSIWQRSGCKTDAWKASNRFKCDVRRLQHMGLSVQEISRKLGVCRRSIRAAADEDLMKQNSYTRQKTARLIVPIAKVLDLFDSGMSQHKIAAKLNIPRTTIATCLQREGRKQSKADWTQKIARARLKYPWPTMQVGDRFFVPGRDSYSFSGVRRHADRRYGIKTRCKAGTKDGKRGVWVWREA